MGEKCEDSDEVLVAILTSMSCSVRLSVLQREKEKVSLMKLIRLDASGVIDTSFDNLFDPSHHV